MIKLADKSMWPHLIRLWESSFGDSEVYITQFLEWNFDYIKTLVYIADDKPVSVAYLLPIEYVPGTEAKRMLTDRGIAGTSAFETKCLYLYAAATLPEYRGRGYFGEILAFIKEHISEPVILVPAEEGLITYYEKQGLYLCGQEHTVMVASEDMDTQVETVLPEKREQVFRIGTCDEISEEAYFELRQQVLAGQSHMRWNKHFIQYICHENQGFGGSQASMTIDTLSFAVMYRVHGDELEILELYPQTHTENCAQFLMFKTGCKKAKICMRPPFMANKYFSCKGEDVYFNLTLG